MRYIHTVQILQGPNLKLILLFLGQGFADKRKKKAAYEYLKLLKKEKQSAEHSGDTEAPKHRSLDFLRSQIK